MIFRGFCCAIVSIQTTGMSLLHSKVSHQNTALLLVLFAFFLGGGLGFSYVSQGGVPCHTMSPTSPLPAGYGSAYNLFSSAKEALVTVMCDTTSATLEVGNTNNATYVYPTGYEWRGGKWQQINFTGTNRSGSWYLGKASARVNRTTTEMLGNNYVVAYTCQKIDDVWKCGCRDAACATHLWQLQAFTKPTTSLPDDPLANSKMLVVAYTAPTYGPAGTQVTLSGSGFSTTQANTILFNNKEIAHVIAAFSHQLSFIVPNEPPGTLAPVTVRLPSGETASGTTFMVTKTGASLPTITSVTPDRGAPGTFVTIRGTNFSPTNNYLFTTFGVIKKLVSTENGTRIVAPINFLPIPPGAAPPGHQTFQVYIYVANENGISAQPGVFTMSM